MRITALVAAIALALPAGAAAKPHRKVSKAMERARKALESCGQAITDRCVESADATKGADCDTDAGLHAEYTLVCLGIAEGK
jgi:hypothetical protein